MYDIKEVWTDMRPLPTEKEESFKIMILLQVAEYDFVFFS